MEIMPFILRLQKEKGNDLWAKWVTYLAYEECDGWHCCNYSCEQKCVILWWVFKSITQRAGMYLHDLMFVLWKGKKIELKKKENWSTVIYNTGKSRDDSIQAPSVD